MTPSPRTLWELLTRAGRARGGSRTLSCDECFLVLEYLAEVGTSGGDQQELARAAREHLARCPDCRRHHVERLRELERLRRRDDPAA